MTSAICSSVKTLGLPMLMARHWSLRDVFQIAGEAVSTLDILAAAYEAVVAQ